MKKHIRNFVESYKEILTIKNTHNKKLDDKSYLLNSILFTLILFGIVLLMGLYKNLNMNLNYVLYSSNIIILFSYFFIKSSYEIKVMLIKKSNYNYKIVVYYNMFQLVQILAIYNLAFLATGVMYNLSLADILISVVIDGIILVIALVFIIYSKGFIEKYYFRTIIWSGVYVLFAYGILFNLVNGIYIGYQYVIVTILVVIMYLIKEYINNKTRKTWNLTLAVYFFLLYAVISFSFPIEDILDLDSNNTLYAQDTYLDQIENEMIIDITSNEDYVFIQYKEGYSSRIDILDSNFGFIKSLPSLAGDSSMYFDKGVLTVVQLYVSDDYSYYIDDVIDEYVSIYTLDSDLSYHLEATLESIEFAMFSLPLKIDGEYNILFRDNELYVIKDNELEIKEVIENDIVLYESDIHILYKEDGIYKTLSHSSHLNSGIIARRFYSIGETSNKIINYYGGLYLARSYENQDLTIYDSGGNVLVSEIPEINAYIGSYPVLVEGFHYEGNTAYIRYTTNFNNLNRVSYIVYELDLVTGEGSFHQGENMLFYSKDNKVEIDGTSVYSLISIKSSNINTTNLTGFDKVITNIILLQAFLFIPLKQKNFVFEGGIK